VSQLDETFRARKAALRDSAQAQAAAIWRVHHTDRNRYLAQVLTLVEGAQRAVVQLTSAYLTAKAREELGRSDFKAISPAEYTVAKLRGTSAVEVYARPFGALYGQLNGGATDEAAHESALADLSALVATDIALAYTASAADWMGGDERVGAYKRVVSGTCDYCESAAEGLYQGHVQMPIHENCACDVEPVFAAGAAAAVAATGLAFHDGDVGATPEAETGDLQVRLDTTGDVPKPPKRRRRR
jgi:hypothetical protein